MDVTRRAVLALPALALARRRRRRMAMYPDTDAVFFAVIIQGSGGSGLFVYDANGKLIDSIAANANVDPQTLSNKVGITSYGNQSFTQITNGAQILLGSSNPASLITSAAELVLGQDATSAGAQPIAQLQPPLTAGGPDYNLYLIGASQDSTKPGQLLIASVSTALTQAVLEVRGPVAVQRLDVSPAATAPPARPTGTEPWNAITLVNGWANAGAPAPVAQYRLVASPPASVEIIGSLASSASTSSTIFTLPAAYRPTHTIRFPVELIVGTAPAAGTNMFGSVTSAGVIALFNIPTVAGDVVDFHALIPLDA